MFSIGGNKLGIFIGDVSGHGMAAAFVGAMVKMALIRIGIYSAALQVSESLWQFARSVSIVQYAKVSNLDDKEKGMRISMLLAKLNYAVTAVGIIVLLIIPEKREAR